MVVVKPVVGSHEYVVPPVAVRVVVCPLQIVVGGDAIVTVGKVLTVTVFMVLLIQPLMSVPVIVYVVVADGVQTTVGPLVIFNAVDGIQVYVLPPLALRVLLLPIHTETPEGTDVIFGSGLTVTSILVSQPCKLNLIVTMPSETPLTAPNELTVAIELLLLVQIPTESFVRIVIDPTQTFGSPFIGFGYGFTFTR